MNCQAPNLLVKALKTVNSHLSLTLRQIKLVMTKLTSDDSHAPHYCLLGGKNIRTGDTLQTQTAPYNMAVCVCLLLFRDLSRIWNESQNINDAHITMTSSLKVH